MDEDFHERFLQANARPDIAASHFADVVRNLIRAVAADDPSRPSHAAAQEMKHVIELLLRCQEPVGWYWLVSEAVREIQDCLPDDPDDRRYINAAKRGMKYLAESSATDNAARGRASRRFEEFRNAIRWSEENRRTPR